MSQENVEVVRRLYALLSRGDQAVWDNLPPEFVFDFSRRLLDPGVVRGRDQVRAFTEREGQMWKGGHFAWQPRELIDASDKVVAFVRTSGRGKASGVEVEAHVSNVWAFRDGEPVQVTYFGTTGRLTSRPSACRRRTLSPRPSSPTSVPLARQ